MINHLFKTINIWRLSGRLFVAQYEKKEYWEVLVIKSKFRKSELKLGIENLYKKTRSRLDIDNYHLISLTWLFCKNMEKYKNNTDENLKFKFFKIKISSWFPNQPFSTNLPEAFVCWESIQKSLQIRDFRHFSQFLAQNRGSKP